MLRFISKIYHMKKILFICVILGSIFMSCGSSNHWSQKQQQQWMDFCNNKFATQKKDKSAADISSYCLCVLDKIQGDYPSLKASLEMSDEKQLEYLNSCEN